MTDTSVIIMAGGTRRDWAPHGWRQLLSVEGETLIDRTARLVKEIFQVRPVILTNDYTRPFGYDHLYYVPQEQRTPSEALGSTERYWRDTTVILQGDTFYPEVAMNIIYLKGFFAYGRGRELYALKFERKYHDRVREAIGKAKADQAGRLWCVYRAYEGLPIDGHKFGPSFYTFKDADSPSDFDRIERYNEFMDKRRVYA